MHIRTILVALDGSAASGRALAMAEELAAPYSARLVLLTVLERLVLLAGEFPTLQDPAPEVQATARKELERKASEQTARGRRAEICVAVGEPCETLLELAERYEADVIMTGRSGKGAVARMVMGSVTTSLLHRSDRPSSSFPEWS
jgi:nucleotide-binding universal stress UspA family protein